MYSQSDLALAADDAGEAVVAWISIERYGDLQVARAALRRADGSWEAPQNLGYAGSSYVITTSPSVAMDARGDALVVWTGGPLGPMNGTLTSRSTVYAEFRPAGAGWGPAVVLSQRAIDDGNASVAMNRRGDALAVWSELDDTGHAVLVSSFRGAGGSAWTPASRVPITDPIDDPEEGSLVLDEAGSATLVAVSATGDVEAATHAADASAWSGPSMLGNAGTPAVLCVRPRIAIDRAGDAVVIWGGAALHATRRSVGSPTWEKSVLLASGPQCRALDLAADPAGNAVAVWNAGMGLEAAILDMTPPVLTKLRLPKVARAGREARFAVSASDLWTSLAGPPLWRFGDRSTRKGAVVTHTFREPGRYRVSVAATDEAGNTISASATVRVTPRG